MGTKMAWPLLCTLPKGQTSELEPLSTYENTPRHRRVHSRICGWNAVSNFPLLLHSNYSKQISEVFSVKCEIKANASLKPDFSPIPIAKIQFILYVTNILWKKSLYGVGVERGFREKIKAEFLEIL